MSCVRYFFFFNDTATTEIYTLSLHDALPISCGSGRACTLRPPRSSSANTCSCAMAARWSSSGALLRFFGHLPPRSEEHTSELQSRQYLVCRLLLEKKKQKRLPSAISLVQSLG